MWTPSKNILVGTFARKVTTKSSYRHRLTMKLTLGGVCLSFFIICSLMLGTESVDDRIDYNQPIQPDVYRKLIGPGFAVKYFSKMGKDPSTPKTVSSILSDYQDKNFDDIYQAGFRNVRLRCCAGCFAYPYNDDSFKEFLNALDIVVTKSLEAGIIPIISWANGDAQATSTEEDRINYLNWWGNVAEKLKDKDYRLGFNLVTELLQKGCTNLGTCNQSITANRTNYHIWMSQVKERIRGTGGNNKNRILILGSPQKGAKWLGDIESFLYEDDPYMMAEWHVYASGPTGKTKSGKYWEGCGNDTQRYKLIGDVELSKNSTPLYTYFGAWMVYDNKKGLINQTEAECFAKHFVSTLKEHCIPWSLNALEMYYWTHNSSWRYDLQPRPSFGPMLNMSRILDIIKENMPIFNTTYLSDLPTCTAEKK